jgi:hypothetical protein
MEGLSLLPPQQKQALLLYELGGLSYRQVAAELEITESAADALLIRARRTLRRGRLVLFPLPLSLPLPRSLQRLLRHAESTARACASVGAQATAAGATTLLLTATAALATTADQTHSSAQAVAAAPAESERAQPRDPIARRSSRQAAHPNAARPTGTHRHAGTQSVITAAVDVHQPTAAATLNDRMPESSKRSQPAATIARTEVTPPARTVAPQDQHLAEAHPGDRAVAETHEAPNPTTTPPRTHPPTPSTSPQHDSATPPTTTSGSVAAGNGGGDCSVREFLGPITRDLSRTHALCGQQVIEVGACPRSLLAVYEAHAVTTEVGEGPFLRTGDLGFLHEGEVAINLFKDGQRLYSLVFLLGHAWFYKLRKSFPDLL